MDKWTTTKSESLVDNHWVKIRKDSVVLPNEQKIDDFYVITINNAAAIVAIDEDGNCILKKEYRYCYDRDLRRSCCYLSGRPICRRCSK